MVYKKYVSQLTSKILEEIRKDREEEIVDKDLIKLAISQYIIMGYERKTNILKTPDMQYPQWQGEINLNKYDTEFERALKKNTEEFYETKSGQWFNELACFEYIQKINGHLVKEELNANYFLQEQTKAKVIDIVLRKAVENQAEPLTNKQGTGCEFMFESKKLDQLKLMYNVFNRIDTTIRFIIEKMEPYILKEGKAIVTAAQEKKDKEYPINFTKNLLAFKAEIDDLIARSFNQDMRFQRARDQAFMDFMNGNKKTPHFIAMYLDNEFKKGFK